MIECLIYAVVKSFIVIFPNMSLGSTDSLQTIEVHFDLTSLSRLCKYLYQLTCFKVIRKVF